MQIQNNLRPLLVRYRNGYRQFYDWARCRWEFVHRRVIEKATGMIPRGYEVHHIDGDKLNNRLSNLAILSRSAHRALHRLWRSGKRRALAMMDGLRRTSSAPQSPPRQSPPPRSPVPAPSPSSASPAAGIASASLSHRPTIAALGALIASRAARSVALPSGDGCCPRCSGSGYLPEYSHHHGGVCFRCGGDGGGADCHQGPHEGPYGVVDDDHLDVEDLLQALELDDHRFAARFDDPDPDFTTSFDSRWDHLDGPAHDRYSSYDRYDRYDSYSSYDSWD